jgi:hypothetical protein
LFGLHGSFFLRFWFLFWFWFFPACLLFVPVHVRKRGDRFKSATFPHFFDSASAAKVPRTVLDLLCVLPSRKTTPTAALNLTGDFELALSMFMATIDTLFSPALHRKGNATVTFVALGNATVTFDRVTYSKQVV